MWSVFLVFLRLGLTSFGGPTAHLGYFRDEFVARRHWLTERSYGDLIALCQFLPGPASSQVGMALGFYRASYAGALAAWVGFTLPSAVVLILFALGLMHYGEWMPSGALQGLKVAAVAVVAQAVWGMARHLCPDTPRMSLMVLTACFVLWWPAPSGQLIVISVAALLGLFLFGPLTSQAEPVEVTAPAIVMRRRTGLFWLLLYGVFLLGLPALALWHPSQLMAVVDAFYRAGALVFGGGHVVLPLLQAEVVPTGWVANDTFLAGYGATQAMPGPLFTFAAFLGASMPTMPNVWVGGVVSLLAVFAPSFFLIVGALPFWEQLRRHRRIQAALLGVNAAVVGLLLAALYQPVWTSAIYGVGDFGLALLALVALRFWRLPPWLVVISCGVLGALMSMPPI